MKSSEDGWSAFPTPAEFFSDGSMCRSAYGGMTLRQYAAIKLKVPESGTDWLDAMIEKSLRDDLAAKAMQGMLADSELNASVEEFAFGSYSIADAMLAARKGGPA